MSFGIHTLDSLRKLVRKLYKENNELRELLKKSEIPCAVSEVFNDSIMQEEDYDPDQGSRIQEQFIDKKLARRFYAMFWGREDVYAKRAKNGGYYPQCANRWDDSKCPILKGIIKKCEKDCVHKNFIKLNEETIVNHLIGYREDSTDVIGTYPLLPDGTCRFLVFDFDNHQEGARENDYANTDDEWHDEVDALRLICKENGIDALVERSRSGKGAHVWIFFHKAISASIARNFSLLLLDKGASTINLKTFRFYDRMYPSQDMSDYLGNLIALPLQGKALKNGNSAFVDENWNAYPNQWDKLFKTQKLTLDKVKSCIIEWQEDLFGKHIYNTGDGYVNRPKPWKRNDRFIPSDVTGALHIVLADGVYIDTLNLAPRLQNQIRCLATIDNPKYYENKRLGYSNYNNFSTIYMGIDIDGYIKLPRGLLDNIINECKKAGMCYEVEDERERGRRIRVSFTENLKFNQDLAVQQLLTYETGILNAATAFGKTAVCNYLISQRKVNTLIIVDKVELLTQWEDEINKFLNIDEEPPEYKTKTGKVKKRLSVIGTLHGGRDKTTGIIDIALIGSLYSGGKFHERLGSYGMVIMDECHHAASATAQAVLQRVRARFVYGVSATLSRSDKLDNIILMLLGPVRHKYTALERAKEQGICRLVIPRYTRVISTSIGKLNINDAYLLVSKSDIRNSQIIDDINECIKAKRTPVILTKYKEHAKYLYDNVRDLADYVFLMYGDNSDKENIEIRDGLKKVPHNKSLILIATGQKIGEGFDYPRLDTLMLVSPVSHSGRLEQYVGRLNRDYDGKQMVFVYDFIDSQITDFRNMYRKRVKTYKKMGFNIISDITASKQNVNAIYDSGNYTDVFEQDLVEAESEIVISSPGITKQKVDRLIYLLKSRQEAGVKITVITMNPETALYGNADFLHTLIKEMMSAGIFVKTSDDEMEHYAVIDGSLVWHGGVNLLGKEDAHDNLIRINDMKAAAELLQMSFSD